MDVHPDWGRTADHPAGYLSVYCPDHPNAFWHGYVLAHRLIVELHLGQFLPKHLVVHHINEDKRDNRIENLRVMTNSDHIKLHMSSKRRAMVKLECPQCKNVFSRERRQTHLAKGGTRTFCSRRCIGAHTASTRSWRPMSQKGAKAA